MLVALDECGERSKLLRYATDNLSEIPVMKMDTGGFATLLLKMNAISDKINTLKFDNLSVPVGPEQTSGPKPQFMQKSREVGGSMGIDMGSVDLMGRGLGRYY